jgi:hypothetical protein
MRFEVVVEYVIPFLALRGAADWRVVERRRYRWRWRARCAAWFINNTPRHSPMLLGIYRASCRPILRVVVCS